MPITPTFGFVVIYVPDVAKAATFYTDVLGLKVERAHPTFIQFDSFALASDESLSGTQEPEFYWLVDDAEAAHAEISARTEVAVPLAEQPFGKVFAVNDPDGRPCFLLELSKNRPSEAVQ